MKLSDKKHIELINITKDFKQIIYHILDICKTHVWALYQNYQHLQSLRYA